MKKWCAWPQVVLILIFCYMGLLAGACGIKTPPQPPREPDLPRVKDLDAVIMETGVQLAWSIPFTAERVDEFDLYRSKPETAEEACPACPRDYELVRTVNVKAGQTLFQVVDRTIEAEGRYYYRVTPLDERGRPGPDSNEAEVIVRWRRDTEP
jgi:hypothetical protein